MNRQIACAVALSTVLAVAPAFAQTTVGQKDPNATAILAQAMTAAGWVKTAIPMDAIVTGTKTRYAGQNSPSATFTLKIRGADQYWYAEDGSHVVLGINGAAGTLVNSDGKRQPLPPHTALSTRGVILPMFSILADWDASDVDVTLVGSSSIQGEAVVGIHLARQYRGSDDPLAKVRRLISPIVVWISTTRGIPLRADHYRAMVDNQNAAIRETVLFFDYRDVGGVAVPFRQDVLLGDRRIWTLQFSTVRFNAGLSDADFKAAEIAGGGQ